VVSLIDGNPSPVHEPPSSLIASRPNSLLPRDACRSLSAFFALGRRADWCGEMPSGAATRLRGVTAVEDSFGRRLG